MSAKMVVTHQKVTLWQKRRRQHARDWKLGTMLWRLAHFASDCDICDYIYGERLK